MQKVIQILQRYHKQKLIQQRSYKRKHKKRMNALKKVKLDFEMTNEIDYFNVELLVRSLRSKRAFEKIFFQVYTDMQDYWEHMNFAQRKQQVELVLKDKRDLLPVFDWEGQLIYLPCFDTRVNRIYRDELVMLDHRPYRRCIRDFKIMLDYQLYGYHRYIHGFTSLKEAYHRDDYDYVLYHPTVSRFYIFKDDHFIQSVAIEKNKDIPEAIAHMIGKCLLEEDFKELLEIILMCNLVSKKCEKALLRYARKKGVL